MRILLQIQIAAIVHPGRSDRRFRQ